MSTIKDNFSQGPFAYNNWRAAQAGLEVLGTYEYPFFTDTHIDGEDTKNFGPYKLLFNTVPELQRVNPFAAIVLRLEYHLPYIEPNYGLIQGSRRALQAQMRRYHGGIPTEEIAALLSLCLGVRMKSGGMIREFLPGHDPLGRPRGFEGRYDPILVTGGQSREPILPDMLGTHSLNDALIFQSLPNLGVANAIALISAARLYQDAVWVAESQPELAWLMLVSALETGANAWDSTKGSATERLMASKPELALLLRGHCEADVLDQVADLIADSLGSTKKFVSFVDAFFPEPPKIRPEKIFRLPWSKAEIEKSMKMIYKLRSKALHDGTPFPRAMCTPPLTHRLLRYPKVDDGSGKVKRKRSILRAYDEKPLGFASTSSGVTWPIEYTPMLLRTFAHITREVLLKWWGSLLAL